MKFWKKLQNLSVMVICSLLLTLNLYDIAFCLEQRQNLFEMKSWIDILEKIIKFVCNGDGGPATKFSFVDIEAAKGKSCLK